MAKIYWEDKYAESDDKTQGSQVVNQENPLPVGLYVDSDIVEGGNPLPVREVREEGYVKGIYFETGLTTIPGVGAAAAYANLDGFGTEFILDVPKYWLLTEIDLYDIDDEGATMNVWLARESMGVTSSDNNALVIPDFNIPFVLGNPIVIDTFGDANTGQVGAVDNIDRWMYTPNNLYVQLQSGGTPNIAAGASPSIRIKGLR